MMSSVTKVLTFTVFATVLLSARLGFAKESEESRLSSDSPELPSQELRKKGDMSIEAQVFGISSGFNTGIMAGYNLAPNSMLLLKYEKSQEAGMFWSDYRAQTDLISLTGREFVGNSLYIEGGLATHKQTIHRSNTQYNFAEPPANPNYKVETVRDYTRSDAGLVFGIGNQWQFTNVTLGCEWIGVYVPISSTTIQGEAVSTSADGSIARSRLSHRDSTRETPIRLLNFRIGYSF